MPQRAKWTTAFLLVLSATTAACGEGDPADDTTGICLTDEQICSLEVGVSKKEDIIKRFGPPSATSMGTNVTTDASYICVRLEGGREAYSQGVFLYFDPDSVLTSVDVTRRGPEATPIPECVKALRAE